MQDFEKLGAFYLGKAYDLEHAAVRDELLLYDSKDLTTHAVCVGMTGSGKTGLCLTLLEEAAIDGVPAIAIDPKGDLGNLLLTFPELKPDDFRPWVDESAATRAGMTVDEFAAATARTWREGLASWGQTPERIARFRDAVDLAIYTPGSSAGLPLTVLRSFAAPQPAVLEDADALRERVGSAASGLLALLGIEADPVRSREHILVSNLFDHAWREGRSLGIASLIRDIQSPPFQRVGVFDLESFYPADDRLDLSMRLNNLLASPAFASWLEGEPLDVKRLLYTPEGKPRLSILSIAHLSEAERMFFVTILLNEVLAWIRGQPGTSSLRALLYMDEVFGYFPPTANPPSKTPMLTLLKQARAYGLGIVLATQNPVDLDYKGLSNTGTWFLGRLQTERDKLRVLEGLEGASAQAGSMFDRGKMEATLAALGNRVFLMNNVHEDAPVVFQTRWALSYLRGPLTRAQIQALTESRKARAPAPAPSDEALQLPPAAKAPAEVSPQAERPVLPPGVEEVFLAIGREASPDARLLYRPALLAAGQLHFVRATYKIDTWRERLLVALVGEQVPSNPWEGSAVLATPPGYSRQPREPAEFAPVPPALTNPDNYDAWAKRLQDHLYRHHAATVWKCPELKQYSEPDELQGDFRIRLTQLAHEQRDLKVEKLRSRYGSKLATLNDRIESARKAVQREQSQYQRAALDSVVSIGSSILGALFGRKLASSTNVRRASTSVRGVGRAAQQHGDVSRAQEKLEAYQKDLAELEEEFRREVQSVSARYRPEALELEELELRPRKSDIRVEPLKLAWTPWLVDETGAMHPAFEVEESM